MLVNKKPALVRDVYFLQIEKIERGGEKCEADGWLGSRMGGVVGKVDGWDSALTLGKFRMPSTTLYPYPLYASVLSLNLESSIAVLICVSRVFIFS